MLTYVIYGMIFCGAALMVYNICGFIRFARYVHKLQSWKKKSSILYIPILLLILFFLGYLAVGFLGDPDLITSGILFGGSIFVFVIYHLLNSITRQILQNERLEAELMASEKSSRAKASFLASISHEMRTPINVILGLDKMALKDPELCPKTREHLEKIGLSTRHLMDLINNILDMNEMEKGEFIIKNEPFSMKEIVAEISAVISTLSEEKGLEYRVDYLPSVHDSCEGDPVQIKHVLSSILDNAVKYTDAPGSVRLTVDADPLPEKDGKSMQLVCLRVSDTGIGIDSSFLPKLFERFSREDDSSTSEKGGSGLSLALAKNLMELMGGTITVESEKGTGSTFTMQIPLVCCPEKEKPAASEEAEGISIEGRRILIVEDIPENAEIVADLLELEGAESDHAENGQIAVEMFSGSEENYYDAVLMDLRMPVMDGLEATRQIRALRRSDAKTTPIVALTANAFESDVRQSLEAGMNEHMAKPTDADLLYSTLKRLIKDRQ